MRRGHRFGVETPPRPRGMADGPASDVLMALRPPVESLLSIALRRVARKRPDVFERLGSFQEAAFLLLPDESPVAFRLAPQGVSGTVRVVRRDDPRPCAARISGPLASLLGLFDGSIDADAAYFSRDIRVDGDVQAVMALHNTLEAAELTLADLLGLAPPVSKLANSGLRFLLRIAGAQREAGAAA